MSLALFAAGSAQVAVALLALVIGKQHSEFSSIGEIIGANAFFILLWSWSAILFRHSAQRGAGKGAEGRSSGAD
jgi:hypothetical protein